jgi:bacterioferritin (cytochrome b1)
MILENYMTMSTDWSEWWRGIFARNSDHANQTVEILRQRYVEVVQRAALLKQHAEKMQYPQFRDRLVRIATEKSKHAGWIGEKIVALGGKLPEVQERLATGENSWQRLRADLDQEDRTAGRLLQQMWSIESEHPEVAELLQRIYPEEKKQRAEIVGMLMRSDPFAASLG